jgi:RNA-directed DNA polymerase
MDKAILQKWLKAGYMERGALYLTTEGTPQGGIISPCLTVMALSGLEQAVKQAAGRSDKVNVVIYADDFVITGASKKLLEEKIKPAVSAFLKERGLELSEEKTKISHIDEGFDFLGFNVRKYKGKMLIKPSKSSIKRFLANIRETINSNKGTKTLNLIWLLNPKIRGWANYFRHVVAKETFSYVDSCIFKSLFRWIKRRHPNKNVGWQRKKYYRRNGLRNWVFSAVSVKKGKIKPIDLTMAALIPIVRHVKIQAAATPYDPSYKSYFARRQACRTRQCGPIRKTQLSSDFGATNEHGTPGHYHK